MMESKEPPTILVADDDPDILNIVSSVLELNGYSVIKATNGTEALNAVETCLPDIAVLDLTMPGASGSQVCTAIRKKVDGELVPVMILTARDGVQDKITALDGGADEYVTKPFNHNELVARVRALMRIRALNLSLSEKNFQLKAVQEKLVLQERALAVNQLAGTAAHKLGQPLSAIMLNIHLVEQLPPTDERHKNALAAIKQDSKRMAELIEKMKEVDPKKTQEYYGKTAILDIDEDK